MYQSYVHLEVRVLLSAVPGVFIESVAESGKKDILSAKSEFLKKLNEKVPITDVKIQPSVLHKVVSLVNALGGTMLSKTSLEKLTASIQEPPDDKNFTGFSVKVAEGGGLDIMFHKKSKRIVIEEVRVEEDRGRLTRSGGKKARMDFTYAGCPVIRIRTSQAFELGEEAEIFLQELYTLLAYLNLITVEVGESSVRCNAYVSLSEYQSLPNYYVKLRNLNSFNFVRKAVNFELSRQEKILLSGGKIALESRLWNAEQNVTESYQSRIDPLVRFEKIKPEVTVDLPSVLLEKNTSVELPATRRLRLREQYGLSRLRSIFICGEKDRADYFETAVSLGAEPLLCSHWMAGELMKLLNRNSLPIKQCNLTAEKFSKIMQLLCQGKIHSGMAKTLMQTICTQDGDVDSLVKKFNMVLLSNKEDLEDIVDNVISSNEKSVSILKKGDMAPLEYLTGCVMKKTEGKAVPLAVKSLIKEKLKISVVYVLTMGGAITAQKQKDGTINAGSAESIRTLLDKTNDSFPVQITPVRSMLSEETEPSDWAKLIAEIKARVESGTANGIVVTHGTDTLCYTASLLFWLFAGLKDVPIVLTSSTSLPSQSEEAKQNLNFAIKTAHEKKCGVYVAHSNKLYSPLNLKFLSSSKDSFVNWNIKNPLFTYNGNITQQFLSVPLPEAEIMAHLLKEASKKLAVLRLYPGLYFNNLENIFNLDSGIQNVVLELYASGTGNMRNSDYSLKPFLLAGRKRGVKFYCTSQQECSVDFSEYSTSAKVWREGAVPMGALTTESVVALYFASYLIADTESELAELIENSTDYLE